LFGFLEFGLGGGVLVLVFLQEIQRQGLATFELYFSPDFTYWVLLARILPGQPIWTLKT
jgi:hypothetical protein